MNYLTAFTESTVTAKIGLGILEILTCCTFLWGGLLFFKYAKRTSKVSGLLALLGAIFCFVGGFPNAADKTHWIFAVDTPFDSSWMFAFVGVGYVLMAVSSILVLRGQKKESKTNLTMCSVGAVTLLAQMLPKPIKMTGMLLATVGMVCFYVTMYLLSRDKLGKKALLYFVPLVMTLALVVFEAAFSFESAWPNMLAQTCNNVSYVTFICLNLKLLKAN